MANKKIKLEESCAKASTKKEKDVEAAEKEESLKEAENKTPLSKEETTNEPMEVTSSEDIVKEEKTKLEIKEDNKEVVTTTEEKMVKKRENTPSTASEDETETDKPPELMEITEQQSEEEDNGLLTACGPVVAASTVAAKKQQEQQKETKDNERESSSDEAAKSMYSIHKNSSATANTKTVERLTVTLAKNSNKKTANERMLEEQEKRCKMLHTMETYIRSILTLMQKDEDHANNEQNADTDGEERVQVTIPARATLASAEVGIMSDSGSSDDEPTIGVPKSPSATPPPLAPLSRGDSGLTIAKVTSTATLSKTSKQLRQVDTLSIDEADEDEDAESEKQSDLNKSSSSTGSSLPNGAEVSTTQMKSKVANILSMANVDVKKVESDEKEAEVASSPASPTEMLPTTTVDHTQL